MLWCSIYFYYRALLNKTRTQVLCISDLYKFLIIKAFNLFRLLEKETLKIFTIGERRKRRDKFGGTKICKAEEVRKYFVNPKIEITSIDCACFVSFYFFLFTLVFLLVVFLAEVLRQVWRYLK